MPSFNLVDQPFIPCVLSDGNTVECGLRDVLVKAHEIAEIRDASPLVTVAIHRLLLAILHRCYQGPRKSSDRVAIRKARSFDVERIERYFKTWNDRFDLFHAAYPFYQRAGFCTKEPMGINGMSQELSRGNNAALFDHTVDDPPPTFEANKAARILVAEQGFAVGGGKSETGYRSHAPLVAAATVLAYGDTLFDTLWLNLTVYDGDEKPVACDEDDSPVWERKPTDPHTEPSSPRGYLDYLTWQSRTLRLHPDEENGRVVVRLVSYAQGRRLETSAGFFDPMTAYFRRDEKEEFRPVRFNEFRDLWRDSAALFQVSETYQKYDRAPTCLHTLSVPELQAVLPRAARYRVSVFGLCNDSRQAAKVNYWRHESLPLPLALLDHPLLVESLKQALELAENVAHKAIWAAVREAAASRLTPTANQSPDPKRVGQLIESLGTERLFWSRLELPFREFIVNLAADVEQRDTRVREWYGDTLREAATDAFDETVGRLDGGRDLKAVSAGRSVLFIRLRQIERDVPGYQQVGGSA